MATTRLSTVIGNVIVGATGPQGPQGAQGATGPQGATPSIGGSNTHIQFNNSGSLGGTANLVWNGTELSVAGDIFATGNKIIGINGTGVAAGTFAFRNSSGVQKSAIGSYYNIANEGNLEFINGTTTSMVLNSSGNLGVGTTSPNGRLEVVGSTGASFNAWFRTGDTTATNNAGGGFYNTSSATAASRRATLALDADGANLGGGDYFIIEKSGNSGTADILQYSNAAMRFGTNYISRATYDMTLDASGNLIVGDTSSGRRFKTRLDSNTVYSTSDFETSSLHYYINNASATIGAYTGIQFAVGNNGDAAISAIRTGDGESALTFGTRGLGVRGERVRIDSGGNFSITQTPGKYTVDVTGGATSIANGGTVDFPSASGMLVVNNWQNGAVTLYLCGGGAVTVVSNVIAQAGSFAYNSGIGGYTWTNNVYGGTATFGFFFVRTRTTA